MAIVLLSLKKHLKFTITVQNFIWYFLDLEICLFISNGQVHRWSQWRWTNACFTPEVTQFSHSLTTMKPADFFSQFFSFLWELTANIVSETLELSQTTNYNHPHLHKVTSADNNTKLHLPKLALSNMKTIWSYVLLWRHKKRTLLLYRWPSCCSVYWFVWLCLFGYSWWLCYENVSLWYSKHHMERSLGLWVMLSTANKQLKQGFFQYLASALYKKCLWRSKQMFYRNNKYSFKTLSRLGRQITLGNTLF